MATNEHPVELQPFDVHNQQLQQNVHPPDWVNPTPSGRYNLVVIGAGTGGLVTAAGAAGLGAKVALIERNLMGGDCLNVGCVPSKGVIAAARAAAAIRRAADFGVHVPDGTTVDFAAAMDRMRRLRAAISPADSAARFRDLGVDVFLGQGEFTGPGKVRVGDQTLAYKKAVIATGARAAAPPIPGLDTVDYLTNESVFSLTKLPARFGIVGAGPIGCELAQTFARLGSQVHLVESAHGILPREDPEAAEIVQRALTDDGVNLLCCGRELKLAPAETGIRLQVDSHDQHYDVTVDRLLVAVGRAPNVQGLGLESVNVKYDPKVGIQVDDRLRTTNSAIYAVGDVASKYKFTHAADFLARTAIRNALFFGRAKASALTIPWCTYTSPELAHVGLTLADAHEQNIPINTFTQQFADVDRAILDGDTEGFVRIHVAQGTDRIVGATIVAPHAGDLIGEISLAMTHNIGLGKVSQAIHPYPTTADAIRKVGDLYNRTRLTPFVASLFKRWLAFVR